ncbi:MAG: Asp-tRNA(Asn)/Glu-tRNA(Gln) amidotransferase subunit GatC [Cryomorphaceae bacterium]|nr:Asp-tRNA(Asn)/Glu-tRNA(Gln) amidotransferase subunit GatC [Cryomorphaceae bacterium]
MDVSIKELEKIAHLAKIELSEDEKQGMLRDFNKILHFVEKVKELELDNVEPMIYVSDRNNATREDVKGKESSQQDALKNAPDHDTDYIKVPRMVKSE